jgi:hypothetical protein
LVEAGLRFAFAIRNGLLREVFQSDSPNYLGVAETTPSHVADNKNSLFDFCKNRFEFCSNG